MTTTIDPLLFYMYANSLRLHFYKGSDYDFSKYEGASKVSQKSFAHCGDKYFYEKMALKFTYEPDAIGFLATNIVRNITDIRQMSWDIYQQNWRYLKDDLEKSLPENYNKYFHTETSIDPVEQCFLETNESPYEYMTLSNEVSGYMIFHNYDLHYESKPLWDMVKEKLLLYRKVFIPNFGLDVNYLLKYRRILRDCLEDDKGIDKTIILT